MWLTIVGIASLVLLLMIAMAQTINMTSAEDEAVIQTGGGRQLLLNTAWLGVEEPADPTSISASLGGVSASLT